MCGSSPSVFQTTPPQPASKARRTLYSLSVGGAEASQNGFGERMPDEVAAQVGHPSSPSSERSRRRIITAGAIVPAWISVDQVAEARLHRRPGRAARWPSTAATAPSRRSSRRASENPAACAAAA